MAASGWRPPESIPKRRAAPTGGLPGDPDHLLHHGHSDRLIARGIGVSTFGDTLSLGLSTGVAFVALQALINANYEACPMGLVLTNGVIRPPAMAVITTLWR